MSSSTGNTILALLTGATIGAGLGILFAPDKGSNTRDKIKHGFDEAGHNIKDKLYTTSEKLYGKFFNGKSDLESNYENLVSNLSHKTEDVISFLEEKLEEHKRQNAKLQK